MAADDADEEWPTDLVFDEAFVQSASIKEEVPLPAPSPESLREVKAEAKRRARARARGDLASTSPVEFRAPSRVRRVVVVFAILVVVGAGAVALQNSDLQWPSASRTPDAALADPVGADEARDQRKADRDIDPWLGTRAAGWPRGASGIEPPKARSIGSFSGQDVGMALSRTEDFLEAAMLDESVVFKGKVDPVLVRLADPEVLRAAYGDPQTEAGWAYLATRFRPNVIGPVGDPVRALGWMKPRVDDGVLEVRFSYAAAYAVRSLRDRQDPPELIVVRREGAVNFAYDSPGAIGLPSPLRILYISDHSQCGRKWPYPAFTESWMDSKWKGDGSNQPPKETHDLTDPKDSLRSIKGCFTNSGSL